jgi:protein arginine N-methyltransferase 1
MPKSVNKDTKLVVNQKLQINLDTDKSVKISKGGRAVKFDFHTLSIIEKFCTPNTISKVMEELKSSIKGAQDWIAITNTIFKLYNFKILIEEDKHSTALRNSPFGYNSASFHIGLLNDKMRTSSFLDAIKDSVKKGDIVVDIGTGTGILAIAAALSGAKHVYAIESSDMGKFAKQNFKANKLEDKITLIQGWSTQVSLPERADMLVSEVIGNEPLGENILEIYSDAFKRHLKPKARIIPKKLKIYGCPVNLSKQIIGKHYFTKDNTKKWESWYKVDFSNLAFIEKPKQYSFYIQPYKAKNWNYLSKPILLSEINLKYVKNLVIKTSSRNQIEDAGDINGILIFFVSELGRNVILSTDPVDSYYTNSWYCKVWILPKAVSVKKGDKIKIDYYYKVPKIGSKIDIKKI